jgi:predicted glutamine amidotransferase
MCKLFAATSLTPMDWPKVRAEVFTAMAYTEKDGIGAAWSTAKPDALGRVRASGLDSIRAGSELAPFCEGFAKWDHADYDGGPVICHGRTSTNYIGLGNTHPFVKRKDGTIYALAHNGVVTSEKYKVRATGCDSELILQAFMAGGVKEVAATIDGYYALLIIEKSAKRQRLHVIRDDTAQLVCGRIGDGWALATTESILKAGGATPVTSFKRNMHAIFEGNDLISCKSFVQTAPKTMQGRYYLRQQAGKAFAGQQLALENYEAEEARLQARLAEMEEKGMHPDPDDVELPEDETMNERGSLQGDWPAHGGPRGAYD